MHEILNSLGLFNATDTLTLLGGRYKYSDLSLIEARKSLLLFLTGSAIGLSFVPTRKFKLKFPTHTLNIGLYKSVFVLILMINIFSNYFIYLNSKSFGYVQTIHGASQTNYLFILSDLLLPVVYSIILQKIVLNKKEFFVYSALFIIPYVFLFLAGFRGELLGKIIAIICIYSIIHKINFFWLLVGGLFCGFAALSMEFLRFDAHLNILDLPLDAYLKAFMYAGNSFAVIPLTIDNISELYHGWKYFFGGPLGIFNFSDTYTLEGVLSKPYLPQHLTYIIDKTRFFGGSTIGGSVVAEIYLISPNIIVFVSAFIPILASLIVKSSFRSGLYMYISLSFLENIILIPRGGFLKFIDKEFLIGIFFFGLIFISKYLILNKKCQN